MKKHKLSFSLTIVVCFLFLAACFSPWSGDNDTSIITVKLGGTGNKRLLVGNIPPTGEYTTFTDYELFLGAAGPIIPNVEIDLVTGDVTLTATVTVTGSSMLTIKAYDVAGSTFTNFGPPTTRLLRAMTKTPVPVTIGSPVTVSMTSAMEVSSWAQLDEATGGSYSGADLNREEIILLKNDFSTDSTGTIIISRPITLRADSAAPGGAVTITRGHSNEFFSIVGPSASTNGILTMETLLTLDGDGNAIPHMSSIINAGNGELYIKEGVTLTNNVMSSSGNGGAVVISGGTFEMSGGSITGNAAPLGDGGGVCVSSGNFTMHSPASITGNNANQGGGVFVDITAGGVFNQNTGTVSGNTTIMSDYGPDVFPYRIGDTGPGGGLIFYYNSAGFTFYTSGTDTTGILCFFLEAAPASTNFYGVCWGEAYTYATATVAGIGQGKKNTDIIITALGALTGYAAQRCDSLIEGGKTDWFMPSYDELELMYQNLHLNGLGGFTVGNSYFSSTDSASPQPYARGFLFSAGIPDSPLKAGVIFNTRAARAF